MHLLTLQDCCFCFIVCQQPSDSGRDCEGAKLEIRWYYKTDIQRCDRFWFRGCGGNNNNFKTKEECQQTCTGGGGRPGTWLVRAPKDLMLHWIVNLKIRSKKFSYSICQEK